MKNKICIVGEAYGAEEERERAPFVGASGFLLTQMLEEAGIHRADCYLTNVLNLRPPGNRLEDILGDKHEAIKGYPALIKGKYLPKTFIPEIERLQEEILAVDPNLIVCLGNTPTWSLLGKTGIAKLRGTTSISTHTVSGFKVLSTYHPAAVLRQWELRPVTVIDLMKAKREAEFPEVRRPKREIWIEPTIEDLYEFHHLYIESADSVLLSTDIETAGDNITCIGFAPSERVAIVIPFYDTRRKGRNYWPTQKLEMKAWTFIRNILGSKSIRKLFQNGLYDIAFLWRAYGIKVYGAVEDTMLLHHALQPESPKALGFLGSVYCSEASWKDMRKVSTIKRDD